MRQREDHLRRENPVGVLGIAHHEAAVHEREDSVVRGADHLHGIRQGVLFLPGIEVHPRQQGRNGVIVEPQGAVTQEIGTVARAAHQRPFGDHGIVEQGRARRHEVLENLVDDLAGRQQGFGRQRLVCVIGNGRPVGIERIDRSEKPQHVEMQHRAQGQRLAPDDVVIVSREERLPALDVFQQFVAVQNQCVRLVPGPVQAAAPVIGVVVVVLEVQIVAPHRGVVADLVGAAENLDHLDGERAAVQFVAVEFDIDAVQQFLETLFRFEQLFFRDLVVGLHVQPAAAPRAQRRGEQDQCKYFVFHNALCIEVVTIRRSPPRRTRSSVRTGSRCRARS